MESSGICSLNDRRREVSGMAEPITSIHLKEQTPEESQAEKIAELQSTVAAQQQALNKLVEITGKLDDAGILDATKALVTAKDDLTQIAVNQLSREPILNLIKHVMNTSEALSAIDAEKSTKLVEGLKSGLHQAELADGDHTEVGVFDLLRSLNDPDINRAVKFGLNFLKGMGKSLGEPD